MRRLLNPRTYWLIAGVVFLLWIALAWLIVPGLIHRGYREESLALINRAFGGRDQHPVDVYLATWGRLRLILTAVLVVALIATRAVLRNWTAIVDGVRREVRSWRDPAGHHLTAIEVILLGVAVGIAAGFGELLILALRMEAFAYVGWRLSPERVWMIPLGAGLFYAAAATLVVGLGLVSRSVRAFTVVSFLLVWLAADHWLEVSFEGLHWVAAAFLGAGVAVRLVQALRPRSRGVMQGLRKAAPALSALVLLAWAGHGIAGRVSEWRTGRALPAAAIGAPNVLFIVLDTVRAQSMSLYGYERRTTPNLDSLAPFGTTFDMVMATAPWTLPSHASLFTGRLPHETSVSWRAPLDGQLATLSEVLGRHGYMTGAFVSNFFFLTEEYGLDRGFMRFQSLPVSVAQMIRNGWRTRSAVFHLRSWLGRTGDLVTKDAPVVNEEFLRWAERRTGDDRPFFAFLNYMDAHTPYDPPAPFDQTFTEVPPSRHTFDAVAPLTRSELDTLRDAYDNSIAYLDDQLGVLFRELERRGVLDNTLVIVTSDHGESFGEQSPAVVEHGNSLYLPSLYVPLIMWFRDRLPAGQRITAPVSIRAIPATILQLVGADADGFGDPLPLETGPVVAQRRPIISELQRPDDPQPEEPGFHGDMHSVFLDSLHYIRRGDGQEEVYDVLNDPWELNDLTGRPETAAALGELRRALEQWFPRNP